MAHAKIEMNATPEWTLAQEEPESGITSVGGLAHRLGLLRGSRSAEPGRISLAKFVELSRRQKGQSLESLAGQAAVSVADLVSIEKGEGPIRNAQHIVRIAAALGVGPQPLLELAGLAPLPDERLATAALFAARAESVKPLDAREEEALLWFRNQAFGPKSKGVAISGV